jgi:serine/threonine protein kinase
MEPGQLVTPHLRLVRVLDAGSMGAVWVAEHLTLRTQVAVKFMSPAFAQEASLVERFRREAHAAAQIKSVHVVQIFDYGTTPDGTPYIAMELLEGESLLKRLRREGRVPLGETSVVVSQTCKALGKAHALGIVHRDIKPGNIFLVDTEGELFVKLLDFGVAKHALLASDGIVTRTHEKLGTPLYMCPEQLISAKHVDHRADLWSIAVVAYHCLVGRVPFRANNFPDLCLTVRGGDFDPPSAADPDLPPAIDAWFTKALHRDLGRRFETAKQAADEFERAARGG